MSPCHIFQRIDLMNFDLELLVSDESEEFRAVMVELGGSGDVVGEGRTGKFDVFGREGSARGVLRLEDWIWVYGSVCTGGEGNDRERKERREALTGLKRAVRRHCCFRN